MKNFLPQLPFLPFGYRMNKVIDLEHLSYLDED